MHDETKRGLIEQATGAVGSLLKEVLVHRKQMDRLEAEKEKEVELAQVRAKFDDDGSTEEIVEEVTTAEPEPTAAEVEAAIDELVEEEMCAVCRDLLLALKERPPKEQVRGIMEYGTFKKELDDDAGVDELKEHIQQTTVLHAALEENLRAQP